MRSISSGTNIFTLLALGTLALCGCQAPPAANSPDTSTPPLPTDPAAQAFLQEAEAIAEHTFVLRADAEMDRDDRRELKSMYLEFGHTANGAHAIGMYYDPLRMQKVQQYLNGVRTYHLDDDKVTVNPDSVEVALRYTVTGLAGTHTEEWLRLRERPDDDDWMTENNNHFVIISHQIKMD